MRHLNLDCQSTIYDGLWGLLLMKEAGNITCATVSVLYLQEITEN